MRPKLAIYLAAGLTLCVAAISAGSGIMSRVAYDLTMRAHPSDPNPIIDLQAPDHSYQRIGVALLLIAAQLVVIIYAGKLNGGKQSAKPA